MSNILIIPLILVSFSIAASPPILNRSLVSQLVPDNPAVSSAFLIPSTSALLFNKTTSKPSLRVPPSWSFSIGFTGDTFLPAHGDTHPLTVSAQLDTGDPLPSWLHLADDTITFGGVAPGQDQGVGLFNIVVTATSSSSLSTSDTFTLITSLHDLSLTGPLLTRNVTADTKFSMVIDDWKGVQVDGASVQRSSPNNAVDFDLAVPDNGTAAPPLVLSLSTASYPWLAYDPASRTLSGTPPASYAGVPGPTIPALVSLASLTVSTNLTLAVIPSAFTANTLPSILAPPGTVFDFDLAPFLSNSPLPVIATWDPQNATWLVFNADNKTLHGSVPISAPPSVKVTFMVHDAVRDTDSRAEMLVTIQSGSGNVRTPTDRALRKAGKKVGLAVGLVFGIIAAIVLLASFLAVCRRYCSAEEHVNGAYVIDQSAFDQGLKGSGEYEKEKEVSDVNAALPPLGPASPEGRMITKAAFFNAVRERFGSDGSWRGRRTPNSSLGKRARKSKISKPMAMLSSSTSVREGFAERERGVSKNAQYYNGANFTIFGNKNNAHGSNSPDSGTAPARPPRGDLALSLGRVLVSGSDVGLPYDRSRSASDPSQGSGGGGVKGAPRSGSAPSTTTGSHSLATGTGTQSTFETGDSARITNAAGEVPFRRPGFDGRRETLGERSMRETGPARGPVPQLKAGPVTATPRTVSPPKAPLKAALKSGGSTPLKSSTGNNKNSPSHAANTPLPTNPSTPLSTGAALSAPPKAASQNSLAAPSSYRNVFFADTGNDSDGSADDVESAVIRHAVSHDTLAKAGKPRIVAFTHERTPAAVGQGPRRDLSQKVVVQGSEESDAEGEMRMGLEYVRQLGHPDASTAPTSRVSVSGASLTSDATQTPAAEFYASNDSNGSIAGRTRVMSHLVINSHRGRHQTAYSTESTHDSFVSAETELPRVVLGPEEGFNFAAPLDRAHTLAGSALQARQADGRSLPEWLRFRNDKLSFWGVAPAMEGAGLLMRVVVKIWESEKGEEVGGCVIDVVGSE